MHASTPNELFQSYPKLFPFLLKELSDATGSANNSDSKLDTLYPLLLFLAKLRPELIETKKEEEDMNTDNFLVPIEICSGMRHMAVRAMAAKALKSLVPCNLVPKHISRIAGTLLSNPRHLSTNRIHGTLLLILELLESWAQNTPQEKVPNEMEAIIAVLDTILFCDNYARAFSCPSVLLVKLRIMTSVVALRSSSSAKVLLWTLIFTHLRPLFVEEAHDTESPSSPLLLREMLVSFFPLFMDLSLKEYKAIEEDKRRISLTDLLNLLHHRMSEVREGLLRGLLLIVDVSASVGMADLAKLALPILLQRCSYETFPPLLELVLRAFSSLTEFTSFSDLDADFATAFHDSLPTLRSLIIETIAPQSSDGSVATEAMRMRGLETSASVTRILAWSISSSCPMSTLADFVLILESSVDDDVPDSQRLVAAQTWSVVFTAVSSLKKDGRSEFAELQCRVWLLALTLIQDDSEDVREAISYSLLPAILADRHGDSVMPIDSFLLGHLGRSVSRALEPFLIRDSLSTETSTEVLTILINRYLAALPTIASSGNVFRIFEEEVSNLFKEPIMTFDLLHHVIYRAFDVYISSALLTAHDKGLAIFRPVASRGMEVLRTYLDMTLSPHWIGDASFQKEIFSSLYGAVLLLAPMVRLLENSPHVNISPDDKASLVTITSLMAAIAEEIPDIRGARHMHPLIFKLVS